VTRKTARLRGGRAASSAGAGAAYVSADEQSAIETAAKGIQGARQLAKPPGRSAGYRVGGISPFAQRKRVPVAIEETALRESTVFLNGGQRGLQIELAPDDARAALDAIACPLTS